ncbi:MAG TPA: LysR substrate-binding domain-containing protein [Arsenicitalea sp.]|nr:LysR substrate-binding domain-containing protein [Arsenicitalea sp.]
MNKFQDILAFVRVAELGSFTTAARALAISTSAVTKSVNRVECDLGVQLLHRTTRQMHLTDYGREYFERCMCILGDLDAAEADIRKTQTELSGMVKISVTPSFGRKTLVPALNEFYRRYPKLVLEMSLKVRTANPVEGGFDLAIHAGRLADSGLVTRTLIKGPRKTVASPAYLERMGVPQTPRDLLGHNCIVGTFGAASPFGPGWPFRDAEGREEVVRVTGSLGVDSGDVLREAALAGIGVAQATFWLFQEEIHSGNLVPLLEDYEVEAEPISIVFPAHRHVPAKVRAVVDFLIEITGASNKPVNACPSQQRAG